MNNIKINIKIGIKIQYIQLKRLLTHKIKVKFI
jgi:hypothetical protein